MIRAEARRSVPLRHRRYDTTGDDLGTVEHPAH
jgi:hypothetical protein